MAGFRDIPDKVILPYDDASIEAKA